MPGLLENRWRLELSSFRPLILTGFVSIRRSSGRYTGIPVPSIATNTTVRPRRSAGRRSRARRWRMPPALARPRRLKLLAKPEVVISARLVKNEFLRRRFVEVDFAPRANDLGRAALAAAALKKQPLLSTQAERDKAQPSACSERGARPRRLRGRSARLRRALEWLRLVRRQVAWFQAEARAQSRMPMCLRPRRGRRFFLALKFVFACVQPT